MGLIIGLFYGLFFAVGGAIGESLGGAAVLGIGFAIGAPIIYGILGFCGGAIAALVINLALHWVGGFDLEVEDAPDNL